METRAEEAYQKKCQFLCDIYESIGCSSKTSGIIITRKKAQSDGENWSGIVNEIKSMLSQSEVAFANYTERIVAQQIEQRTRPLDEKLT